MAHEVTFPLFGHAEHAPPAPQPPPHETQAPPTPAPQATRPPFEFRPYQKAGIASVLALRAAGKRRTVLSYPTSLGKTATAIGLWREIGGRLLWIAHTDELVEQPRAAVARVWPEMADRLGVVKADRDEWGQRAVFASIQTLSQRRRCSCGAGNERNGAEPHACDLCLGEGWLPEMPRLERILSGGAPSLVVCDEAHRTGASSWRRVLARLELVAPPPCVTGLSATIRRTDKLALDHAFDEIAYRVTVDEAIRDGWLCPYRVQPLTLEDLNLRGVRVSGGDFNQDDLNRAVIRALARAGGGGDAMTPEEEADLAAKVCAQAVWQYARDRKTIAFVVKVDQALRVAQHLRDMGLAAEAVSGETPRLDRRAILRRLSTGDTRVVVNVGVLCLDAETEVLTDTGWAGIDTISPEHRVANWDNGRIFFAPPKAIVRRFRGSNERMVALETKCRSVRVSERHRMLYRTGSRFLKAAAIDLVNQSVRIPISGDAEPLDIAPAQPATLSGRRRRRLVSASAYNLRRVGGLGLEESFAEANRRTARRRSLTYTAPRDLSLAECGLIGFWLGDGSRNRLQSGGVEYTLCQGAVYPHIIAWVDATLRATGIDFIRRDMPARRGVGAHVRWSMPRGTGHGPQQRNGVFSIEPYLDKDGARYLWGLTAAQFDELLYGLWLADGDHGDGARRPKGYRISGTNRRLFDLLQAIAVCRGLAASIHHYGPPRKSNHAQLWRLSVYPRTTHCLANWNPGSAFAIEDGWRPERLWCVSVDSCNIVTRRRGTVTVTGNTEGFDEPTVNCIALFRPTKSQAVYVQQVGRGLRLYCVCGKGATGAACSCGKPDCLILDLAGVSHMGLATVASLSGKDPEEVEREEAGKPQEPPGPTCPQCAGLLEQEEDVRRCPACGYEDLVPPSGGDPLVRGLLFRAAGWTPPADEEYDPALDLWNQQRPRPPLDVRWLAVGDGLKDKRGDQVEAYALPVGHHGDLIVKHVGRAYAVAVIQRKRGPEGWETIVHPKGEHAMLEAALAAGVELVRRLNVAHIANARARWRSRAPSPGVLSALEKWRVKLPEGRPITAGEASELLLRRVARANLHLV